MSMRDYEDLKNLKIHAEQERIMNIICDAWKECRTTDCQSECKDNQVLPCERTLFACTALKYSRKIHEAGYAPVKWIDARERLPENSNQWGNYIVAVIHENPLYFIGNTFVVPALYNSQQKMWIVLWGPGESEHLNALISPEKSQPDEHCVAYWMNMPALPEAQQ